MKKGSVGAVGNSNIGYHYARFEAMHVSSLRMVCEGREMYANPSSILRADAMLLRHIGYPKKASMK